MAVPCWEQLGNLRTTNPRRKKILPSSGIRLGRFHFIELKGCPAYLQKSPWMWSVVSKSEMSKLRITLQNLSQILILSVPFTIDEDLQMDRSLPTKSKRNVRLAWSSRRTTSELLLFPLSPSQMFNSGFTLTIDAPTPLPRTTPARYLEWMISLISSGIQPCSSLWTVTADTGRSQWRIRIIKRRSVHPTWVHFTSIERHSDWKIHKHFLSENSEYYLVRGTPADLPSASKWRESNTEGLGESHTTHGWGNFIKKGWLVSQA